MHGLRQRGYSLAEALVGLLLTLLVMVVVLGFFDAGNRLFHTQLHLGTLQQSLRPGEGPLLRWARMAGRGGLPGDVALVVVNDVPAERRILDGSSDPEVPLVAEGSDVLQIRGVFSGPVYAVHDSTNPGVPRFQYDPVTGTGFVTVVDPGPGGIRMSTADLEQLVEDDVLEALYLSGSSGQQVAVELDPSHDEIVVDEP